MNLKILHRIYFGFDGKPDPYDRYLKSWKNQLPEFQINYWNADNLPIDICYFSKLMFDLRDHAFLSDYFRWWVLREYGGVYLDADIEIIDGKKFQLLVEELEMSKKHHSFLGIDNKAGGWYTGHSVASVPNSPLTKFMCEVYEGLGHVSLWRRKIFYFMSPQLTALYFASNGHNIDGMGTTPKLDKPIINSGVKIYPQEYFSPLTPVMINGKGGFEIDAYTENTTICHHFSCSWHDSDSPYKSGVNTNLMLLEEKYNIVRKLFFKNKYPKFIRIIVRLFNLFKSIPSKLYETLKNA
ncbi:hypothetical protein LHV13_06230 [Ferrovum sp. PN-J185]|uniref:glycosyltransferase family 32 protein n=1 Tax=Ferrovum sp. PN-J185 TaxID=1356306 RepID=UPI001E2BA17E|nr:glycosyltransferase [Ferrovum sp. PN-J185]MCC6068769.1 hypothetical protein [Ferrovum sp. PN-J185]